MQLAEPELLFARFTQDALTVSGARAQFELFVLDLVKMEHPTANTVKGKGGRDWGIDTLVGSLSGGRLAIWQCKYVPAWEDDSPRGQVRTSFKSAIDHAAEHRYTIATWTLCVPCALAPAEQRWFDGWASRQKRETGIEIAISNGYELRHKLLFEDNKPVRAEYFPETLPPGEAVALLEQVHDIDETADLAQFDGALFVRQLHEAGEAETDSARGLFFATDALVRDYEAKADASALAALRELHVDAHRIWEARFNAEASDAAGDGRIPGLHGRVMNDVEGRPDPVGMRVRLRGAHRMGAVHRLVEDEKAGWVAHWRDVVVAHRSTVPSANVASDLLDDSADAATVGVDAVPSVVGSGDSSPVQRGEG